MTYDLLFEIGCDELPARLLHLVSRDLCASTHHVFRSEQLMHGTIRTFVTPRRCAIFVDSLMDRQPISNKIRQGPPLTSAFDQDHKPTAAAIGFAQNCGVSLDDLKQTHTHLVFEHTPCGRSTMELLPDLLKRIVTHMVRGKKMMRWGNQSESFIRPVQWILALYDTHIIPVTLFGIIANRHTYGHRFHHPDAIHISHPQEYEKKLKTTGYVIPCLDERSAVIANELKKLNLRMTESNHTVLQEIAGLVEWPSVYSGSIAKEFLNLPQDILETAIRVHQKCFLHDEQFIFVSNIKSHNIQKMTLGYERVVQARLKDAQFFYHHDLMQNVSYFVDRLQSIGFQEHLGSLLDRAHRLNAVLKRVTDIDCIGTYALIDQAMSTVSEFPELSGTMGALYLMHHYPQMPYGDIVREHHHPQSAEDRLPRDEISAQLALTVRADLLIGLFGINHIPTGEKDPYALRRAALGIVRILINRPIALDLQSLLDTIHHLYLEQGHVLKNTDVVPMVYRFIMERFRFWCVDTQNIEPKIFEAAVHSNWTEWYDLYARIRALRNFYNTSAYTALLLRYKRVRHILKKCHTEYTEYKDLLIVHELLPQEAHLLHMTQELKKTSSTLHAQPQALYELLSMPSFLEAIDEFFEHVHIHVPDDRMRTQRIWIVHQVCTLFESVAKLSCVIE